MLYRKLMQRLAVGNFGLQTGIIQHAQDFQFFSLVLALLSFAGLERIGVEERKKKKLVNLVSSNPLVIP